MIDEILIVDDEPDLVELVSYNLKKENFSVDTAYDGDEALRKLFSKRYSLIILDIMLPGIDGLELCKILRSNPSTNDIPVIMLTAKSLEEDKIKGLNTGADDYVTKPFSPRELIARVKALLRRTGQSLKTDFMERSVLKIRDLVIDKERYTVYVSGKEIRLSAVEFKILLFLAENSGRIIPRERILERVWGENVFVEPRTVDVHIRRIRAKIEDDPDKPEYIKTMRGVGYFIDKKGNDK